MEQPEVRGVSRQWEMWTREQATVAPSERHSTRAPSPQAGGGTCHCGGHERQVQLWWRRIESGWRRGDDVRVRIRAGSH